MGSKSPFFLFTVFSELEDILSLDSLFQLITDCCVH